MTSYGILVTNIDRQVGVYKKLLNERSAGLVVMEGDSCSKDYYPINWMDIFQFYLL